MKVSQRNTCACRTCDNIDLPVLDLHQANVIEPKKVQDVLANICCDNSSLSCLDRSCTNCTDLVISYKPFEDGEISYEQRITVEEEITTKGAKKAVKHVAKKPIKSTVMETVDFFEDKVKDFMRHQAIKLPQFRALKGLKPRLTENEVLIHCDFSENYAMKYGREIQSVHFGGSRKQFTLHTVVIYYTKSEYEEVQFQYFCTLSSSTDQ